MNYELDFMNSMEQRMDQLIKDLEYAILNVLKLRVQIQITKKGEIIIYGANNDIDKISAMLFSYGYISAKKSKPTLKLKKVE